ncbi:hypothetical protein KIW84_074175 [Lathyrus oleraceus]|uniref:UBN2 domain-containing protein n=1 Tax=Pisum sativum TaxID=3888 RepID=A0A9D4VQT2_PEA|nr:hypothetical protein KIW84_074175 [Pisum sativum]
MTKFNGLNYADWSEMIQFQLGVMDLDMALIMDEKPAAIMEDSTKDERSLFKAWERSNGLSLNLMRMTMAENVKPFIPNTENERRFMKNMKEYSNSEITDKSVVGNLMSELTTKKFEWSQPIHDHVTQMESLIAKLKSLVGYISNYGFSKLPLCYDWRVMLGIGVIPSIFLAIAELAMPESPRWLVAEGRLGKAKKVLYKISDSKEEAHQRLNDIK